MVFVGVSIRFCVVFGGLCWVGIRFSVENCVVVRVIVCCVVLWCLFFYLISKRKIGVRICRRIIRYAFFLINRIFCCWMARWRRSWKREGVI